MKILPCRKGCRGNPAIAVKASSGRSPIYHTAGFLSTSVYKYLCRQCGRPNTLTSAEFAALPEMTQAEIIAPTCDIHPSTVDPEHYPAPVVVEPPPLNQPLQPLAFPAEGSKTGRES